MPDKAWKAWERRACRKFGGTRRGADYGDSRGGKNDCVDTPGWSVELKLLARPTWGAMNQAVLQAEASRRRPGDIPVALVKQKGRGRQDKDALVIMRLEEFEQFFLGDK